MGPDLASVSAFLGVMAARLLPTALCPPLQAAQAEVRRGLNLAFRLAVTHGRVISLEPHRAAAEGRVTLRLPEGVRWGRPASVPLPPVLAGSGWRGSRPRPITVTPHRRTAANVWFLHHGREALCLRLDLRGGLDLWRFRPFLGVWTRA